MKQISKPEIFLTMDVDLSDEAFKKYDGYQRINATEIIKTSTIAGISNQRRNELLLMVDYISKSTIGIIIGNAFWSLKEIIEIKALLMKRKLVISAIFIASTERIRRLLEQSLKEYRLHSRWFDYPQGYIEDQFQKGSELLQQIK